jgi:hypothetical protein
MEPRREDKREPEMTPGAPKAEPKPRRFRMVKLEERIAPAASYQAALPCTCKGSGC